MYSATIHTAEGAEVYTIAEYGADILERCKLKADLHNQGEDARLAENATYVPDLWTVTSEENSP